MIRNETMKFIIELENKNGRNFINRNIEIILQCIIHDLIVSLIHFWEIIRNINNVN